jgi:hypothetical protein
MTQTLAGSALGKRQASFPPLCSSSAERGCEVALLPDTTNPSTDTVHQNAGPHAMSSSVTPTAIAIDAVLQGSDERMTNTINEVTRSSFVPGHTGPPCQHSSITDVTTIVNRVIIPWPPVVLGAQAPSGLLTYELGVYCT